MYEYLENFLVCVSEIHIYYYYRQCSVGMLQSYRHYCNNHFSVKHYRIPIVYNVLIEVNMLEYSLEKFSILIYGKDIYFD